jgi:transposase InsO family protein
MGEYLFVVILDAYSCFPELEIVHSTSASSTITKLERIFATTGIPSVIKSDKGLPFISQEFQDFIEEMGIRHTRLTPLCMASSKCRSQKFHEANQKGRSSCMH